ncbi:class I SAM-dependent methyltransferase [Robiginitalea sediminis]|uniref:class I SAM-dependent methyltransferase n=1 Tax=Robiginitalea sediminis TaxID=1982593 RepID=UPI000B4AD33E|nr:class I SAM-dependent methyltransferase [Robiginitalea sediminis]
MSDSIKVLVATQDFMVTQEAFNIVESEREGVLATRPVPNELDTYYQSDAYISHTDGGNGIMDRIYRWAKQYNLKSKLRGIHALGARKGALLDIGAGTGAFMEASKRSGWKVWGVEPNAAARKRCKEKGLNVTSAVSQLPDQQFDCITLWHVLEHVQDLDGQLGWLESHLTDSGLAVIAVPNYRSLDARIYGSFWAAYDTPRHLWHFSPEGIRRTLEPFGLVQVSMRPLWLDAFYVSWLSERYKGSRLAAVKGFAIGLLSNLAAVFTRQPSSVTYYFRKREA